jgi:N-acetylglucosaminyldiphosphoundecaprenol N-acetyl-beta-D-mannosaminyltransferase
MKYDLESMNVQYINSIPVFAEDLPTAVANLVSLLDEKKLSESICISCTGAHGMIEAQENTNFKKTLQAFYLNLPDGMPLVWLAKLKGYQKAGRCYGPDLFGLLLKETSQTSYAHFFCGGKPGVAEELKQVSQISWPGVKIAGLHCPPFRTLDNSEWAALATAINDSAASIVWIGLGTPKQEVFAATLAPLVNGKIIITVGAAFDFYTGKVKQAPKWIQQIGMEWFYRLLQEPKRLGPRYLKIVPKFTLVALANLWGNCLKRN